MTCYSNHDDRHILSSPAVLPYECISPATLLASLTSLSVNTCNFKSSFFPTQRQNARKTIRQVGIILIFLQEIWELPEQLPILCFSELHFYFQKIRFLLQDCTRRGAELLWMVMKSQHVASQFWYLTRGVTAALDVLPLHQIEVCLEVKGLVELVTKQIWRTKFEVDPDDERIYKRVHLILCQFEREIEPDLTDLKQVLDYLEVKTWTDCNEGIKFLQDEIDFSCFECNEREVPLLSSLTGFLSYWRGVIFETPQIHLRKGAV